MDTLLTATDSASREPAGKKTRHEIAEYCGLSLRYIDELTHNGVLPHFRIGRSIRYDLSEVEAVMRQRFYVRAKIRG